MSTLPKPCTETLATEAGYCAASAVCEAYATYVTPEPVTSMQGLRVIKLDTASMSGTGVAEDPQAWVTTYSTKYGPDIAVFIVVPAIIAVLCILGLSIFCMGRVCGCCKPKNEEADDEVLDSMPTCFMDRIVPIAMYGVTVAAVAVPVILGLYSIPTLVVGFTQAAGEAGCLLDDALDWTSKISEPLGNLTAYANQTILFARTAIAGAGGIDTDLSAVVTSLASLSTAWGTAVTACGSSSQATALTASLSDLSTGLDAASTPTVATLTTTLASIDTSTATLSATLGVVSAIATSTLDLVTDFMIKMKTRKDLAMGYLAYVSQFNMIAGIVAYSFTLLFLIIVPILAFFLCLAKREQLCLRCCVKWLMEVGMALSCTLVAVVLLLVVLLTPWSLVFSDVCVVIDDASYDWSKYINGSFAANLPINPVDAFQACFDRSSVLAAVGVESSLTELNRMNFSAINSGSMDVSAAFDFSAMATLNTAVAGYTLSSLGWTAGPSSCATTLSVTQSGLAAAVTDSAAVKTAAIALQTNLEAVNTRLAPTRALGDDVKAAGNCGFVRLRWNALLTWLCGDALRAIVLLSLSFLLLGFSLMMVFSSIFSLMMACKKHRYEDSSSVAPARYSDGFGSLTDEEAAVIRLQAIARGSNARKLDVPPSLQNHLIQCFAEVDVDGSGTLDEEEFWRLVAKAQPLLTSTQIDRLRKRVDTNHDGVDWNEFVDIAPEIFKEFYSELYADEAEKAKASGLDPVATPSTELKGGGWIVCAGAGGKPYYYNARTGERTWTKPAELVALDGEGGFTEGSVAKPDVAKALDDPPPAAPADAVAAKAKADKNKKEKEAAAAKAQAKAKAVAKTTTKKEGAATVERTASSAIVLPPQLKDYLQQLFSAADVDKSGELDKKEFIIVIKQVEPTLEESGIEELWGKVDKNGDGALNYKEFVEIAPKLFSEFFTGDKPEWISCTTDDTPPTTYYYNNKTGESTWEKPAGM